MCGICGFVDFKYNSNLEQLKEMTSTLNHRGPDDKGAEIYIQNNTSIGLGQTRLSILDLSPLGHQPMEFENYSIVFNGEIYNFEEIKTELENLGHVFKSNSDTEVILHSFKEWGEDCVSKFIGMFVFVIYDKIINEIFVIRDRAGVKPFYYYWNKGLFLFASELKAFHRHSSFEKKIDVASVHQYMDFGYIPSPNCIFENCFKLDSGHILRLSLNSKEIKLKKYWDVTDFYKKNQLNISYEDAKNKLERLLKSACEYRMISDVPVGVFLSGGFDSTAVTALLQRNRKEKLKTFTIGFEEGNDEAPFARDIAKYLKTDHREYYCTTKEAQDIIKELPYFYDEPFADSSAIPTTLVSKMAKRDVTVALSADAGDEVFGGYNIYGTLRKNLNQIKRVPKPFRKVTSKLLKLVVFLIPKNKHSLKHKISTIVDVLNVNENEMLQELYKNYFRLSKSIQNNLFIDSLPRRKTIFDFDFKDFKDETSIPLAIDYSTYLENDILAKVDRATMSVSLEGREPFLDHRIIEFAARLPMDFKFGKTKKRILKDIVYKYVPKKLMDRPKTGFSIPIYTWLKNDLKYLIDNNLDSESIKESGIFKVSTIEKLKNSFFNGTLDDETIIWKLLQFQMWYKKWIL